MHAKRLATILLILAGAAVPAFAAAGAAAPKTLLWKVTSAHRTLYLTGVTQMLRPADYPLPAAVTQAFSRSGALMLEGDPAPDRSEVQALVAKLGLLPHGQTLIERLGPEGQKALEGALAHAGVPLAKVQPLRPWVAALVLLQAETRKLGVVPAHTEVMYLYRQAHARGMQFTPLETAKQQIGLFAGLPEKLQVAWLVTEAERLPKLAQQRDAIVAAWRKGDTATLARLTHASIAGQPALYRALVLERNKTWLKTLGATLAARGKPVFVAVGATHVVGAGNLVQALRKAGYRVQQL